ncbi:MAG: YkgJ family cysteine cluster protein [Myxococcales bacterium]|nr:YkgJ family cysteine cluster protein [Myxococcales bacterium]
MLCRRCGLCCDGALFTSVPLADGEIEPARRHGLVVVTRGDGTAGVRQRCAALRGDEGCAVYEVRPGCCRRYRCMLLRALDEGEVSPTEALAVVEEAHARLAAARAAGASPADPEQRRSQAPELRAALAWLGRHFERAAGRA